MSYGTSDMKPAGRKRNALGRVLKGPIVHRVLPLTLLRNLLQVGLTKRYDNLKNAVNDIKNRHHRPDRHLREEGEEEEEEEDEDARLWGCGAVGLWGCGAVGRWGGAMNSVLWQVEAPFVPKRRGPGDTSNLDDYEEEDIRVSVTEKCAKEFSEF
ncbi:hypothetical protein AAFF_G00251340 [Aldrovandia affinis]|uniref:Uncharacterized protein n=1 Tax=Aldrovandia affinis TaxID=143900 RepID=A0AAD7RD05_9TELE|nr:hypothetical protein AAFF_G00251340 [Aldrovandia affinis]